MKQGTSPFIAVMAVAVIAGIAASVLAPEESDAAALPVGSWPLGAAVLAVALTLGLHHWGRMTRRRVTQARRALALRTLFDTCPDAWIAFDGPAVLGYSPRLAGLLSSCDLSGMEPALFVRTSAGLDIPAIITALHPADGEGLRIAQARLTQEARTFTLRVRTRLDDRTLEVTGRPLPPHINGSGVADAGDPALTPTILWLRDVTASIRDQRRTTDQVTALTTGLERVFAALDELPVPLWLRGADLALLWCNAAYARGVGAPADRVVAEGIELMTGAETPSQALAGRAKALGTPQSDRRRVVVAGDLRLLQITEQPLTRDGIPGPSGAVPGGRGPAILDAVLLGMAQDVTREQELAAEMERHTAAHGAVLEHLGSAIAVYGPDTRLTFHNRAYAQLWGLDEAWLATSPSYGEVLEDLRTRRRLAEEANFPRWKRQRLAQFQELRDAQEELTHLPDGTTLRSLAVPHPLGGLMFIDEDVTNALALESSYNTLMAVQQETLNNLAEGVAVFGGDGRLKLWNPSYAHIWHLSPADLNGEPHIAEVMEKLRPLLNYGDDWETHRDRLIGNLFERTAITGRVQRVDNSIVAVSTIPLPDGAVLISALDITDSVRVEEALRASNEALATADRLKSEFIANVSHQLRTPLNAIMGFSEILNNQYFGPLNERQADYAKGLMEASQRLLTLINDILDLATIEAGFMELDWRTVSVPALFDGVIGLAGDWATRRGITLDTHVAPGAEQVQGDERRLKQALYNLVSNAVKYSPAGGKVLLTAERGMDEIVLSVSDTGIGIPPDDRARVFNKFERGNGPAGAGLGLSLVKSLVELHGGVVEIDNLPGTGSVPGTTAGDGDTAVLAQNSTGDGTIVRCHLPCHRAARP